MTQQFRVAAIAMALAAGLAGCTAATAPYDKADRILRSSRETLASGDRALVAGQYERAQDRYRRAARHLADAVGTLSEAEQDVQQRVREQQLTVTTNRPAGEASGAAADPASAPVDPFYTQTLEGYRRALARAVAMRSLALAREGEAYYRRGAARLLTADANYGARQFAAALEKYRTAREQFEQAVATFGEARTFVLGQMVDAGRLARAADPAVWRVMRPLADLVERRRAQADAYLAAATQRIELSRQIVAAYEVRRPGNLPDVRVRALPLLPELLRAGVQHPPLPPAENGY